ncbi:lipid-A-disaccharide synthase N-terminal domain-containing protein [Skermanella sp. TT6]|uniref:Lipid-A-disaccharide synthase N-terminal domain-containing protein n=1 Tax=Skermanella cutis TaxID=2775420 RepID=A0ABX7B8K0_9PROT|nr:lipid-A-disaccharide synthase N-terminal domain-containing protein [Skermanella sp. TT6]QQP89416.1 lipid-A-disaccharide synthase N-terminal domain-containing protein [Skermanella sp. TT6]
MLSVWTAIGFVGQALFSMRFVIQWIQSERLKRSFVPETFWYFSMAGGITLLAYAIHRQDPVFILGQGLGLVIYSRNIWMIWRDKRKTAGDDAIADDIGHASAS